jgi:hypothetical protein
MNENKIDLDLKRKLENIKRINNQYRVKSLIERQLVREYMQCYKNIFLQAYHNMPKIRKFNKLNEQIKLFHGSLPSDKFVAVFVGIDQSVTKIEPLLNKLEKIITTKKSCIDDSTKIVLVIYDKKFYTNTSFVVLEQVEIPEILFSDLIKFAIILHGSEKNYALITWKQFLRLQKERKFLMETKNE